MVKPTFEMVKPDLISLGFSFHGEPSGEVADPERTLLAALHMHREEPKVFKMLLAWLERHGDLVHVERIRALATNLADFEMRLLGALALKQAKGGDRRFSMLADWAKKSLVHLVPHPEDVFGLNDLYLISKYGLDEELRAFGIEAAKITPADPKKLLAIEGILRQNAWLRFRALIGANFRADLAFIMAHKRANNPYQAAKILGCSQETAYRLWKGLLLYPGIEKLAG